MKQIDTLRYSSERSSLQQCLSFAEHSDTLIVQKDWEWEFYLQQLRLLWFLSHYPSFPQSLDTVTSSAITELFIISCLRWWCSRLVINSAVYHLLIRQHLYLWRILYVLLPVRKFFRTKDSTYLCADVYWNFLFTADLYSIMPLGAFVNVNTLSNAMCHVHIFSWGLLVQQKHFTNNNKNLDTFFRKIHDN